MKSSPLRLLGPELISRVLKLLHPHEYSGFSNTCRGALELVKRYEGDTRSLAKILRPRAIGSLWQGQRPPTGMDSSPLGVLPPELIYHVLDFMHPHEYSGLSCTCQRMLSVVNQKLNTPQSREFASLNPYVSRTAAFVKAEHEVIIWGEVPEDIGCYYISMDEDDYDL